MASHNIPWWYLDDFKKIISEICHKSHFFGVTWEESVIQRDKEIHYFPLPDCKGSQFCVLGENTLFHTVIMIEISKNDSNLS